MVKLKDLKEENIIAFVKFNEQPFNVVSLIAFLLLTWLIGMLCAFLGAYTIFTKIFFISTNTAVTVISFLYSSKEQFIYQFLYISSSSLNFSLILLFASFKFFVGNHPKFWILIIFLLIFFLILFLFCRIIINNIHKNIYKTSSSPSKNKIAYFAAMGSSSGIIIARLTSINASQENINLVISFLLMLLALILCFGIAYLFKFYFTLKYKIELGEMKSTE